MDTSTVVASALLAVVGLGWFSWLAWTIAFHLVVFRRYAQLFDNSIAAFDVISAKFEESFNRNDLDGMGRLIAIQHDLLQTQDHYLRALRAVRDSQNVPPWRWCERWKADYLEETRAA